MNKELKYSAVKEFITNHFITTDNKDDRLHTKDILHILYNSNLNKFSICGNYTLVKNLKSLKIGQYKNKCIINGISKSGFWFIKYVEDVKISTSIGKEEVKLPKEQFIIKNFKTTDNKKDRLHTMTIFNILTDNGYKLSSIEVGRLINSIKIGKYNDKCNIDKVRKGGFEYIKYIGGKQ